MTKISLESLDAEPHLISAIVSLPAPQWTQIFCFFTGQMPPTVVPMKLQPTPKLGDTFDANFGSCIANAALQNPAAHDGAIMLGRSVSRLPYQVAGWSYRLTAAGDWQLAEANRGSAYNSCSATASVSGIDFILLRTIGGLEIFSRKQRANGRLPRRE